MQCVFKSSLAGNVQKTWFSVNEIRTESFYKITSANFLNTAELVLFYSTLPTSFMPLCLTHDKKRFSDNFPSLSYTNKRISSDSSVSFNALNLTRNFHSSFQDEMVLTTKELHFLFALLGKYGVLGKFMLQLTTGNCFF